MGAGMCDAPEESLAPSRNAQCSNWLRHLNGALLAHADDGKNLANARQQDFVEDVVGGKSAQIVVAGSDDHHHFKVGKDNEPLTSVAHRADIARPPWSLDALIWR